jgi:hypothetical protein
MGYVAAVLDVEVQPEVGGEQLGDEYFGEQADVVVVIVTEDGTIATAA